jgi:hypothetical protein
MSFSIGFDNFVNFRLKFLLALFCFEIKYLEMPVVRCTCKSSSLGLWLKREYMISVRVNAVAVRAMCVCILILRLLFEKCKKS